MLQNSRGLTLVVSVWAAQAVDTAGNVGLHASLAFGPGAAPVIAYLKEPGTLRVARLNGSWAIDSVDACHDSSGTAAAVDGAGNAYVAYYGADGRPRLASYSGSTSIELIDSARTGYKSISLALDSAGAPQRGSVDDTDWELR